MDAVISRDLIAATAEHAALMHYWKRPQTNPYPAGTDANSVWQEHFDAELLEHQTLTPAPKEVTA